ncbi:MAG: choice-of-anchor Q domain-containing protein [Aulosira sp. ZfuVER01]|nr:choice-of-anchor Q domain-containing protein [Aulosira sp. ZfuVER01]MDZ8001346.1 choice-of-anchor Q domain-containing protein [Aulosira sp. DedVER01a]MDZ8051002.1 choice-of-anchor Q domain-containing protein [Aulosira sp. ZfuCHP01]
MFLDQPVAITRPVHFSNGARLKAEYSDNADLSVPKLIPTDANASTKIAQSTTGKTYYVSGTGNNNNDGLKESTAFRSLSKAAYVLKPGDTVYVMNGTYTNTNPSQAVMYIENKQGTPKTPTTIKAYPGHKPLIKVNNYTGIQIVNSSYITVEGFKLEGNNDNITLQYALQQKNNLNNPQTSNNGIQITKYSHHIVVRNNQVSKFGGAGISSIKSDYLTYENNVLFQNCFYTPWGANTIGMLYNWNSDNNTSQYKMIIRGNIVYENKSLIPWKETGKITEGNGIEIDDSLNTQSNSTHQPYRGKTLIANNISYKNGGAGIVVYSSANVDVVNNTTYQNSQYPETREAGEITVLDADQVKVFNNIMYAKKDAIVNKIYNAKNTQYDYNLVYNSSKFTTSLTHNILGKDPLFSDPARGNFTLRSGSSAIDFGASNFSGINAPITDQVGLKRPQDGNGDGRAVIDIGALEVLSKAASAK